MGRTIHVEGDCEEEVTEIVYTNGSEALDRITYEKGDSFFTLTPSHSDSAVVYIKDIPKLIKALEIAQKEWGE